MSDTFVLGYFVVGGVCVIGCRLLLSRFKLKPTNYWNVLLGGCTEALIVTVIFWPLALVAAVICCRFSQSIETAEEKMKRFEAEERRKKKENPLYGATLNELLQRVEEQKKSLRLPR